MCDCFHLAFPNWHADSSGTGAGRRLRAPEPGTEDDSTCDEPSQFTERERPRPQGSSPVEEYPETEKYTDSDKECEAEHDPHHKSGSGKKTKKSGLGSMFEKRSTPKMSKLKEVHSPESGVIVKTAKDGCAEGLVYGGGGKEGIFIKEVVPESPASKSLKLKEGDQILSATVYFDNVSYEDAIQILEHAQAYKVKLCLKRKPDITETEPVLESDVIPEEDICAPEMREQGKTKRRGDARISWPKFPSFGKGRKTRFTRSHSSSEADDQRKLELSPTTSDTESPIKSQDALKGKKKYKMKLSVLPKRGRISSSEDQDTDAPTTVQMISPECLESPSGETPQAYVTEELKVVEDLRQLTEPQTEQHKVELITIDSTLKTEDLTVALADQESPSVNKSLDEKKKKKERSELKMRILGKDKAHKKAKSSPKRLKTLGASIELADQPENEKSDVIPSFESHTLDADTQISAKSETTQMEMSVPKVELEISDVTLIGKSPQKGEEKTKKGKDSKTIFKLPKIGFTDTDIEETIPHMNVNVEEGKTELLTTEGTVKEDPYERLSKSNLSRTKLPKREDIEIPGMEDMSMRTTAKGIKEPKAVFTGHYEDIQAETVQMSIDVDSVKEAVSKLPGFKLPKVDTSGVPIPEEITVIDANAQRISVKTPTKTKHDAHFSKFDVTASPEISKTAVKLPKITPANLTSEEILTVTQVKQNDRDVYKREHIIIPGKESAQDVALLQIQETHGTEGIESEYQSAATFKSKRAKITMPSFGIAKPDIKLPDVGINLPKGDNVKGERKIFLQEIEISKTEAKIGGVISDVKIPEIDGIEYIDSVDGSPGKKDGGIKLTDFDVNVDAAYPKVDISTDVEAEEHTFKLPKFGAASPNISVNVPDANKDIVIDGAEIKTLEREGKGGKFKIPNLGISMPKVRGPTIDVSLSKKDVDVTLPEAKAEVELPDIPEADVTLGNVDVSIPEQKMDVKKPELEIKPWQAEGELHGQGHKLKKPKFGIKMPKLKGPEFDLSLSKKDVDVTLPGAKAEVKLPEAPEIDVNIESADILIPEQKMEVQKPELEIKPLRAEGELDGNGGKFKMPEFGVKMPKIKGPQFDFSLSKRDVDVKLPEVKAEVKVPDVEHTEPGIKVEVKSPEVPVPQTNVEGSPSKFKMPTFKLPTFGIGTPTVAVEVCDMDKDIKITEADINRPAVNIEAPSVDIEDPSIDVKATGSDHEGKGSKFKMPHLGFSMPKVKGPQFNLSLSKKDVDVTVPEAGAEVTLPEAPKIDVSLGKAEVLIPEAKVEVKKPEVKVKPLQTDIELEGQRGKFQMPKLGITMPKVKGPEIHFGLSKKDGDVSLPEAKAEIKVPDTPEVEVSLGKTDLSVPTGNIDVERPELEIKPLQSEVEIDGQGSKFKMPKLGMSMPKVKGPEFHFGLSKKDGDVSLPEAKAEVKVPDVPKVEVSLGKADVSLPKGNIEVEKPELEIKPLQSEVEIDGQGSKFKMPKLGMSMPKVKGPEFHFGVSKKGRDVSLPEAKAEVELPEAPKISVDMKPPECEGEIDGQGGKFKLPKLGMSMPKVKGPEFHFGLSKKDGDVSLPEVKAEVKVPDAPEVDVSLGKADVSLAKGSIDVKKPELQIKPPKSEAEIEGQGGKFKMPKLGMSMPKVKGPEFHFGSSKKDGDVTLPEVKAEVKVPEVELKEPSADVEIKAPEIKVVAKGKEGSPSKFKMPTFKLPKFGVQTPNISVEVPDIDKDVKIDGADINISDEASAVHIAAPSIDIEGPSIDVKTTGAEQDGKGSKFKMPHLSFAMPKMKGPKMDVSQSKKDIDIKLPETKGDVKLPEIDLGKVDVSVPEANMEVTKPEMEMQFLQTEGEPDRQGQKFKMPKFGIKMPKIKGPEFDLSLSKKDIDVTLPETKVEVQHPDGPEIDVSLGKTEISIPEAKVKVEKPELEIKPMQTEVEGQGSKFKMPKFGMSMPKVKGPEFHLGSSKKDVDFTLPEANAEVNLPDVDLKEPSAKVEIKAPEIDVLPKDIEGSPSKFKMPNFSFSMPKVKGPDIDLSLSKKDTDITLPGTKADIKLPEAPKMDAGLGKAEVLIPEAKVEVKKPEVEINPLQTDIETEGHKGKFQMPKFGITVPKVKGPDIDLSFSKKDVDVTLPEAKAVVELREAPTVSVDIKPPECEGEIDGQGGKFKMPKFGISMPKVKGPEIDLTLSKKDVDVALPEAKAEVELPEAPTISVEVKPPECEGEIGGQGGKFKMPKFGISMPKVKGPEIDFSLSKKDADITLPEGKAEVNLPDVELESSAKVEVKAPEIEAELGDVKGSPSKFKLPTLKFPKFGAATPNVSAEVPDIDKEIKIDGGDMHISVPHTDVDVPEVKADVHLPEVQVKKPSSSIVTEQQPGIEVDAKLKKPRFSLPRFSFSKPSVKAQEVDDSLQNVNVAIPEGKVEVKGGEVDVKLPECEAEVEESKFKMPKFGITMPEVTGPEIDLSLSKKDVDVTLPEAKAEINLPDVEVKEPEVEIKAPEIKVATKGTEGSPSKFKMPTFKIPKFGIGAPSATVEVPDMDKDISIDGADIKIPEEVLAVEIAAPSIDIEGPSINIKTTGTEHEGKGSKFKLSSLGFSGPQVKQLDTDLSLSKKVVHVTVPEAKVDVNLPDNELKEPSADVDIKGPKIKVETKGTEGSPSKFKMPTFKLPKFGVGTPSATVEVPDMGKDIKIDGAEIPEEVLAVEIAAPSIDIEGPSIDIKTTGTDHEGSKFKLPSLSFSGAQIKGPDIDLSLSKKDVDLALPEAKAEVKLPDVDLSEPSAKVEIKAPGIDVQTSHAEGSPSKLKMPTFKLPKFGAATPQVSVEVPDVNKDIKVDGGDLKLPEVKAEVKLPDVEIKESMIEGDAKLKKTSWTLPRFSFSRTSVKAPEADVNLDVPKVDITLPEVKTDVNLPDIDIKESSDISIEGPPSTDLEAKMKKPRFSLPRFSFSKQSSKESKVDVSLPDVDASLPEENVEVKQPEVEFKPPEVEVELEGQESKFKMPKFGISVPKVKGPEIDLSLSKKDVDVTLPEAKTEVQLLDVKINQPSATVEIKAPEIEVQTGNVEGSPSKLKMPTFTLPKFGAAIPKISVEVPDVDKDIKIEGATADVTAPSIDTEGLSVDVKAKESEPKGSGSKFKIPKFGISMPKVKGPEIDLSLSKGDEDVTLPEAKAEIKLPDVEVKEPEVDIKSPEIKIATKGTDGSPSKFKMPTFKLPKFGVGTPSATMEMPDTDKDIKIDGADIKIPEEVLAVEISAPSVDIEGPSVDIKTTGTEHEGKGSKFKLPGLGYSGPQVKQPDIDLSLSKKDVDVTLPEAEVKLPNVEVKETEGAISVSDSPTVEVETKMKRPGWTFPKFSFSRTGGKAPNNVDVNLQTPKVDVTSPEVKAEVQGPSGAISVEEPPAAELDPNLKKTKFSLPRFSFSKSSVKEPEVSAQLPRVDVCLPEGEVIVTQPEMKIKAPELEAEHDGQVSKFKLPKFGIGLPKAKGPEEDLNASQKDAGITLPEVKAEVKLPETEVKESSASVEIKASETEAKESPSKFKMPTLKMPKFGVATYDITAEAPDVEKVAKTDDAKLKEDVTVNIKGQSADIKMDVSNAAITEAEMPNTETESVGLVSPSKFKLPSFTSLGDILKSIDVEFDVPKAEQNLETSKEVQETDEASGKQTEEKETKQEITKSPERTGWFRFPKFGLSSPSEPAKSAETDEKKDEKSPVGETMDDEISPTFSVQSSDAFADISSAMTSEHVGPSSSSPTKVTVKYSDPDAATGLREMHSNIVTSTTRTELISVEPNLPEKITILSSGVSSSSEDTLRLESGKIHVITSNIQATPEAEHAKLLSAVQIQSAGGLPLESEANEAASWTVGDSQGGKRMVFERHLVRETSSERSESKETIVITKQITRRLDSSEPISGETASSIQRLRDSVHSEKMRFFDGVDK